MLRIFMLSLNDDLISIIYDYIPVTRKKFCEKKSFQQYYKLYLPQNSLDWNMEYIESSIMKDTIQQFMDLGTYPMIIHNIYTEIVRQKLEYFFYQLRDNKNKDDVYENNIFINQSRFIYDIICEHCPSSFNSFFIPLGHHLIIMDCLSDIFNGLNYSRWLIQPEKKLLI